MNWVSLGLVLSALLLLLAGCAGGQSDVDQQKAARANTSLASDYLRRGDLDKAKRYFNKALNYDAKRVDALWGLAVVSKRAGHTSRAKANYKKAIAAGDRPALVNSYAAFLCENGDVAQAIKLFKQVAGDDSFAHPGVPLANAGVCLMQDDQPERAETFFEKALAKNKNQPLAAIYMARLALRRGNNVRAKAYIKRTKQNGRFSQAQKKLAARIELAAGNREGALKYIDRYNRESDKGTLSIGQLRSQAQ